MLLNTYLLFRGDEHMPSEMVEEHFGDPMHESHASSHARYSSQPASTASHRSTNMHADTGAESATAIASPTVVVAPTEAPMPSLPMPTCMPADAAPDVAPELAARKQTHKDPSWDFSNFPNFSVTGAAQMDAPTPENLPQIPQISRKHINPSYDSILDASTDTNTVDGMHAPHVATTRVARGTVSNFGAVSDSTLLGPGSQGQASLMREPLHAPRVGSNALDGGASGGFGQREYINTPASGVVASVDGDGGAYDGVQQELGDSKGSQAPGGSITAGMCFALYVDLQP